MAKIQLLENSLINKIAAGEVVERPASVVKELVENAIDAGSSQITVEIADGGLSLIKISDNGSGIEKQFARTAFLRHATSKISDIDDLDNIATLGFRGEALSSIAAVSRLELTTKTKGDETGIKLSLEGGAVLDEYELGCANGTVLSISSLFFNVPARRKFLKKPQIESGYVADIVTKLILAHPEISFRYINNGSLLSQSPGNGDLISTLHSVYGRDISSRAVGLSEEKNGYSLSGLVIKPEQSRANRSYEHFFVNGRYIKSELVSRAAEDAYRTRLMTGKFPIFALYLTTDPANVDVNVHPAKLECRFKDEDFIYALVKSAIEKAFNEGVFVPKQSFAEAVNEQAAKAISEPPVFTESITLNEPAAVYNADPEPNQGVNYINIADYMPIKTEPKPEKPALHIIAELAANLEPKRDSFFKNYRIIGQLFLTYWIVEQDGEMYMIDQHAAHERILYEELLATYNRGDIETQMLAEPVALNLTEREAQTVRDNMKLLEKLGYELELFGERSFAIRAVPYVMKRVGDASFFTDIIGRLQAQGGIDGGHDPLLDDIALSACKAAVKANDRLDYIEAKSMIERLLELENPFNCPHGRPTVISFSKQEIEKRFRRIV